MYIPSYTTKLFPVYHAMFFISPFQYSESRAGGKRRIKAKYKPQIKNISSTCLYILTLISGKKSSNFNSITLVIFLFFFFLLPLAFLLFSVFYNFNKDVYTHLLRSNDTKTPTRAFCYRKQI